MAQRVNSVISTQSSGSLIVFKVEGAGETTLDLSKLSNVVADRALQHGMIQRIRDAAALSRDDATGASASPADKLAEMKALCDHYNSGAVEWSPARDGVSRTSGQVVLLTRALCELFPEKDSAVLRAKVQEMKPADRVALMASPKVKPIIDRIQADAVKGVDAEALLAGL